MDDQPNPNAKYNHSSIGDLESPSNASGMFSNSQQFTVTGGTFTNITNHYAAAPSLPPDLRMIPLGDIDLRHQMRVDERVGVVDFQPLERAFVRRVHSAKARIDGRKSRVTVAMYQGNGAEEEWRQDIEKYMRLRQVSSTVPPQAAFSLVSNGIHATIFSDDLIPLQEVLDRHRESPFLAIYIHAHCNQDFNEALNYICIAFQPPFCFAYWMRRSTGQLCTELTPGDNLRMNCNPPKFPGLSRVHLLSTCTKTVTNFIGSLTLEQYHRICSLNQRQHRRFDLSARPTTINLGAVSLCSSNLLENSIEIAFLPRVDSHCLGDWTTFEGGTGEITPKGWTRFQSVDVFNNTLSITLSMYPYTDWDTWLSQANHIFRRLNIVSNLEDYEAWESAYPSISACDDSDLDEVECSHILETVHDTAGSEDPESLNCEDHNASESTVEDDMGAEEMFVPSRSLNDLMGIQLLWILFLGLSWVYNHVPVSFV
ncbi:hypothetical protein MSAN_02136000 [Mycena sanguinolenta]|uniref:Uncharacterized protein n=1 Tax=Mycena sanguinolenta TaxID=230812 RepID=A0A8H6XHI3_9AGAR|nr:hypothetical protein MSAN_02136000 [Mycena sanguinolenta]